MDAKSATAFHPLTLAYPSNVNLCRCAAFASALVHVAPGTVFALSFNPLQGWVPPEAVVTLCPRVRILPSNIVFVSPSILNLTGMKGFTAAAVKAVKAEMVDPR